MRFLTIVGQTEHLESADRKTYELGEFVRRLSRFLPIIIFFLARSSWQSYRFRRERGETFP